MSTRDRIPEPPRRMRKLARERFLAGRKAETQYGIQLRRVARHIGDIIRGVSPQGELFEADRIIDMLHRYADLLAPWARTVAARMLADVSERDARAWRAHGREIGRALRQEIARAPTGAVMQKALAEQVHYITSLPRDAAERVHKLTIEGMLNSTRASEIAKEIMASGEVSRSRATLIARTETSRTATELTKARAQYVGSTHAVWMTSRDGDVRKSHREMEGKVFAWDDPPTLSDGTTTLPGCIYNCRCFASPILPDKI
jgi:SPP1 gp7 family putative phage head morphogenesis protein